MEVEKMTYINAMTEIMKLIIVIDTNDQKYSANEAEL